MNLNKVFILGNLTRDPEFRQTPTGQSVTTFGIATNRTWSGQSGVKQTQTEFHNIVLWGRLAEIANQYLTKGRLVLIEGRLNTRSWQDQNGQKRNRTEIVAETMQLGPRFAAPQDQSRQQPQPAIQQNAPAAESPETLPEVQLDDLNEAPQEEVKVENIPF